MATHVALLRGINVGGKSLVKMAELQQALAATGLKDVRTYIQSGNILFSSKVGDADKLASTIKTTIHKTFGLDVGVAVFSKAAWEKVIKRAPAWWGRDKTRKHNLLVLIKPYDMKQITAIIGELKPDLEAMAVGKAVIYQSLSRKLFGRTSATRLVGAPAYKQMTIRNYNTATKLLTLLTSN